MRAVSVVAHRGASGDFPENTAVAFQEAIDLGVEMIEFDVQLTADRCLVICHDPSVDRTSDGAGRPQRRPDFRRRWPDRRDVYGRDRGARRRLLVFGEIRR